MAQFEDLQLVFQTHNNFEGLRRDIRANAQAYADAIPNRTVAQIAVVIAADALRYQERLAWQFTVRNTPTLWTKLQTGLTALSLTVTELNAIYNELKTAADFQQAAVITTTTDITNLKNSILANVAAHDRVF